MVGWSLGVLYVDYGLLGSHYPEWLQCVLNIPIGMFRNIGLAASIANPETMTCHLGAIIL